jgi:cell filamentation protein
MRWHSWSFLAQYSLGSMITQCSQFQQVLQGSFDLAHLCKIHSYLFQDVYEWAGEVRSVDIIGGDSRFCNVRQIQSYSHTIFSALATEKYLVNLEPAVFSNRLAHYLSEVNAIHPFRC